LNYINRALERIIKETARGFKVLMLTGARQVGKSTTLEHLFRDYSFVTLDDPIQLNQAINEPGLFIANNPAPIVFDEIQYATSLFPYIKLESDKSTQKGQYLLTGSQQFHLMKQVSESMAGRVGILELSPLSLRELQGVETVDCFIPTKAFIEARKETQRPCADIWQVIHKGGYPELQNPDVSWERFFASYVRTYIERDINELARVQDHLKFTQFMTVLAARSAQMLNYTNIANELEISAQTAKNWVSLLEASGVIFILQPYTNSALNRAIKTPKLYFRDTGLVCYLTKWTNAEAAKNGAMSGALFETFVVGEILKSFSNNGLDYRFSVSYYRGKDKQRPQRNGEMKSIESEIDLIIQKDGFIHPIEIKQTANPKTETTSAFDILDRVPQAKRGTGAIICQYDKPFLLAEDLYVVPVTCI
jgi:predicted AAA+ superfamily ATPase